MSRRFHPDNNYGFDTSEMTTMINMAKEGLQDQLRKNDADREEERYLAEKDVESIPSDHNSVVGVMHAIGAVPPEIVQR